MHNLLPCANLRLAHGVSAEDLELQSGHAAGRQQYVGHAKHVRQPRGSDGRPGKSRVQRCRGTGLSQDTVHGVITIGTVEGGGRQDPVFTTTETKAEDKGDRSERCTTLYFGDHIPACDDGVAAVIVSQ